MFKLENMKNLSFCRILIISVLYLFTSTSLAYSQNILNIRRTVNQSFERIKVSSAINLYLSQGSKEEVRVEAREELHKYIITEVREGQLNIYSEKLPKSWSWRDNEQNTVKVYVIVKDLTDLEASGASDVFFNTQIQCKNFSLHLHGASDAKVKIECEKFVCDIHGSSDASILGNANILEASIHGSSDFKASSFRVKDCRIKVSGSGDATINVNGDLEAEVSGAADLNYYGNPTIKKLLVSGGADARKKD
jgi:hypothetical protein